MREGGARGVGSSWRQAGGEAWAHVGLSANGTETERGGESFVVRYAIETRELTKRFHDVTAVDRVSLTVGKGEIYGFVGLNGAGKTTMMRLLLGMIRPSRGAAYVLGEPVSPDRRDVWAHVGYMVETPHAYPELTVQQNLEVVRRLRGVGDRTAVDRVVEMVGLTAYREKRAGELSLGNRQRLGLAKALLHRPGLLLLDEPTNGLDPAGIVLVRELLASLAREGVTVFLSSHLLAEVAQLVSRLGILHEGRLVEEMDGPALRDG